MKTHRRSYLVESDISLWVIEREKSLLWKLIQILIFKVQKQWKFVREWIFRYLSFWESFLNKNGKWLQCERENENVYLYLSIFFFFFNGNIPLSLSQGMKIFYISVLRVGLGLRWKKVDIWSQLTRESKNCPLLFKISVVWSSL